MKFNIKSLTLAVAMGLSGMAQADTEALLYNNQLEINGLDSQGGYELRLRLPEGTLKTVYLAPTESITFEAADFALSQFADGIYKYELSPLTQKLNKSRDQANSAQAAGDSISGTFTVVNGSTIVDLDEQNTRDQVIADDLIVDGSICVGLDCVNGESFGFDTLRLKENNLRIRFFDTSNSASFPSRDWEITVNDSSNGGANKFSITDIDGSRVPFTIEANARSNALYVDDGGRIGVGTSTPTVEMHIVDGDSPTMRLEQNGSSGWTPQTWDVAGNETNFFIRDATNGSNLPFRIRPSAPSNSVYINTDGRIGFGTPSPSHALHVSASSNITLKLEDSTTGESWKIANKGASLQYGKTGSLTGRFEFFDTGEFEIGDPAARIFDLESTGNLTILGTLSQNSDVNSKENIAQVNTAEVLQKVMDLPISVWNYKFDEDNVKHLGPMAQDFYKLFGLGSREDKIATLDTTGVALASIKALADKLADKESKINDLATENELLKTRLEALEKAILKK
ncbi:tail fiber domain-containing protein [Marinicella sediminis]|uniref:Tail fiber domain-containing protein n=1 Tax=Marinicella sediminis TaxID=1792834 RepID=A0ABV7JAP4_9GAMM|nr:tail fiber domain-containing protein [Marinicella sediminis]